MLVIFVIVLVVLVEENEMKHKATCKAFYKFFVDNEQLSDNELADKIVARFAGVRHRIALDLITTTRMARAEVKNLVERIKNENLPK